MIKYQLLCDGEHEFEGWFQSSTGFDDQNARGLVSCPICDSSKVKRALMAPNLSSPKTRKNEPRQSSDGVSDAGKVVPAIGAPAASPAQGLPPEAVEKMLVHIYTGELLELKQNGLNVDLLQLADMYKLDKLKNFCGEDVIDQLSIDNCISSFIIIDRYFSSDSRERELVKLFMRCKAVQIIESEDWGKMVKDFPEVVTEVVRAMLQGQREVHDCLFCIR